MIELEKAPHSGVEIIKGYLKNLPTLPGVYRMMDKEGKVLYIGKAKELSKRVASYTHPEKLPYRLQRMIANTLSMEFITTETEAEALLLEANLIKNLKPRYNILLRDDKSFAYILLTGNHEFPRITKHRGERKSKGQYFGPFPSAGDVNKTIHQLQKVFLLRPCADSIFENRDRPCLEYQIKRCSGPCVGKVDKAGYRELVSQTVDFLSGKSSKVQEELAHKMQEAAQNMEYERAAIFRDRIAALTQIQASQHVTLQSVKDADIVGIYREGRECCIQVFFFRGGQHFGNKSYFPSHIEEEGEAEILAAFLGQFYQDNMPPRQIMLSHETEEKEELEEALGTITGSSVDITVPKLGEKQKLVQTAVDNAREALARHIAEEASNQQLLEGVQKLFELPHIPKRIEVYDNSHVQGSYPVGTMIVVGKEGFMKNAYRRFNIKSGITPGDDYGMMREVLSRRLKRLKQDAPEYQEGIWPDLLLIDGGAGQLNVVSEVLESLDLTSIPVVGISKGPERKVGEEQYHRPQHEPFTLDKNDKVGHYLQRIRDEAHRYAIGSHRNKRSKGLTISTLDDIPGIGAKRKKALLNHFGSTKAVQNASAEDIARVEGISKAVAEMIYGYFHG